MKAFNFLSAVIAKIKEVPAACVLNDNQYIFIYEME